MDEARGHLDVARERQVNAAIAALDMTRIVIRPPPGNAAQRRPRDRPRPCVSAVAAAPGRDVLDNRRGRADQRVSPRSSLASTGVAGSAPSRSRICAARSTRTAFEVASSPFRT